jgi:RNA polymerase sigma-70 factor, ECF subfamily
VRFRGVETASDATLLRACEGDPDAFCLLYDRWAGPVYRFFAAQAHDVASDLAAETFARAWIGRRRFRDEAGGSAGPWLFGIARNVLLDSVRARRAETAARARLGLPEALAPDLGFERVEERLSTPPGLLAALATLSEAEREALCLRVIAELGYEEIAQRLGVRPAAVRLRVSRALRRLRLIGGASR